MRQSHWSEHSQTPSAVKFTALRSQGATHLLQLPRAFLADLRSCTCGQDAFAFSPNEELTHAQCPRQSDTKPICLAEEQQKTERKGRIIEFAPHRDVQLWYACKHSESVQSQHPRSSCFMRSVPSPNVKTRVQNLLHFTNIWIASPRRCRLGTRTVVVDRMVRGCKTHEKRSYTVDSSAHRQGS